jgi:ferritin-like metal-binding protein YciE
MTDVRNPRELFLHELADILYVEQELADDTLPKLIGEVGDAELRRGLEKHLRETQRHVKNVQRVFKLVGEQPEAEECIGFEGLKAEHDKLVEEASSELIDLVDAGAAARTEHYEIAAYQGLITMARSLGERESVDLLDQNLKEEKAALREVEKVARRLSKEQAKEFALA